MPRGRSQTPDPGAETLEQGAAVADDEQSQAPALPLPEEKLPVRPKKSKYGPAHTI